MKTKTFSIDVPVCIILVAAFLITASRPTFSQSSKPGRTPPPTQSRSKSGRSLDPRLQHTLNLLVSEKQLQAIVQLDREAALLSGKYSRRIAAIAVRRTNRSSDSTSAQTLRELGGKAGASERQLFLALERERGGLNRAFNTNGALSLIQPLNLAGIEAARVMRLRTGSLATEIPGLNKAAICRGDIVTDRLIYRYVRAATAEDDAEMVRALREVQIQLACMSTRQVRVFEDALVKGVEWAAAKVAPSQAGTKRARTIQDAFRQLLAPIIFATADASRMFARHDQPAIRWLTTHKEMLAASALREQSITHRVGLLFANRFSGKLLHVRGTCAPGAKKIFKDGRGGLTCNPLAAFFQSTTLPCDVTQWVPEKPSGAGKFVCDSACAGLPGGGSKKFRMSPQESFGRSPEQPGCTYSGPAIPGMSGAGGTPGVPGGTGSGTSSGKDACGADPMYGVITRQQTPAEAYNKAFTACLIGMAGQGHTSLAADAEVTGYAPGGGAQCMLADAPQDEKPSPEPEPAKEKTESEIILERTKETVKSVIEAFAAFINALHNEDMITAEDVETAKTAVDNAKIGQCDGCWGSTSEDGKTITMSESTCFAADRCFNTLLHEAMHSALTRAYHDEAMEHAIMGENSEETRWLFYLHSSSPKPKSCFPDDPSCTQGCTSREAAAPDCMRAGLAASRHRLREMIQGAEDCAIDACWNPATDDGTRGGQECGNPNPCPGQSVALCLEDQPNCMCRKDGSGLNLGQVLRDGLWRDYCTKANDERCSSPTAPGGFGESSGAPPAGPVPVPVTPAMSPALTFGGGAITIRSDGRVKLGRSPRLPSNADDPECTSNLCRASQRGDW
jgi:hypothetical protein